MKEVLHENDIKEIEDDGEPLSPPVQSEAKGPILKLYRRFKHNNREFQGSWLAIRSPVLVSTLLELLEDFRGTDYDDLSSPNPCLWDPYMILFHNLRLLQDRLPTLDEEPRTHLKHLLNFVQGELPHVSLKLDDLEHKRTSTISFDTVWLLYRPGTVVYARGSHEWKAFIVVLQNYLKRRLTTEGGDSSSLSFNTLSLHLSDSSGMLRPKLQESEVNNFPKEVKIIDLEFIPEEYLPDKETIRGQLIERGKSYSQLGRHPCLRDYTGNAWGRTTLETVSGR